MKAFSSGSNAIALCWSPPVLPNGDILHYTVNIKCVWTASKSELKSINLLIDSSGRAMVNRLAAEVAAEMRFNGTKCLVGRIITNWRDYRLHQRRHFMKFGSLPPTEPESATSPKCCVIPSPLKVFFFFETIHSGIIILLTYKAGGNTAAICSFGRRLTQVSKTNVELPCRVIGNINKTSWTFNGQPIASSTQQQENNNKQLVTQNGTSYLIVTDLKRSDTGNYSCSVKSESINYQLTVAGRSVFLKKRRRLRVGCNRLISLSRQWVQLRQRST